MNISETSESPEKCEPKGVIELEMNKIKPISEEDDLSQDQSGEVSKRLPQELTLPPSVLS